MQTIAYILSGEKTEFGKLYESKERHYISIQLNSDRPNLEYLLEEIGNLWSAKILIDNKPVSHKYFSEQILNKAEAIYISYISIEEFLRRVSPNSQAKNKL